MVESRLTCQVFHYYSTTDRLMSRGHRNERLLRPRYVRLARRRDENNVLRTFFFERFIRK
uniref:Uncharacterized protein n=1 Tax=Hyaloperonospora arabidopsidis (strain Emoy2) TaxID=559515 RepID=M4BQF9_HYAAE